MSPRVIYLTNAEYQISLNWLRDEMMNRPTPDGQLLLEQLELAAEELEPVASRRVPTNVVSIEEWRAGA